MVVQPNFSKRTVSNAENAPPPSVLPKSLASRILNHHRRARPNSSSKHAAAQAVRRSCKQKNLPKQITFKIPSIPTPDVAMVDGTEASSSKVVSVTFPRELVNSEYQEVSREALLAVDASFEETDPTYIRELLEELGPHCLKSLASVCLDEVPENLPSEIHIKLQPIEGFSHTNPTHMLAIYGPVPAPIAPFSDSPPAKKREITLYPVHSTYLAAHCARLPPFAPTSSTSTDVPAGKSFKLPIHSICLPRPALYSRLSTFLYTKNASALLSSFLPMTPPAGIISSPSSEPLALPEHRRLMAAFAYQMASTYTTQVLLQHASAVHGLWQNTCALGIYDEGLWEVIDVAWLVLLAAIAVGTGAGIDTIIGKEST